MCARKYTWIICWICFERNEIMIRHIDLPDFEMDFSLEIAGHSGDKNVVYKEADGQKADSEPV